MAVNWISHYACNNPNPPTTRSLFSVKNKNGRAISDPPDSISNDGDIENAVPTPVYETVTWICFASSAFGRVTVKTPSLYAAFTLVVFTEVGRAMVLWNLP